MLAVLLLLLQFSVLSAGDSAPARVVIQAANLDWAVEYAPEGFEFGRPEHTDDGRRAWVAGDGPRGMIARLTLRPAGSAGSANQCREQSDARDARGAERLYRFEHGRRGALWWTSYVVPDYQGVTVNQRHLHAFLYREGYCVELELSMPRYRSRHQGRFDDALDALQIVDSPAATGHDR